MKRLAERFMNWLLAPELRQALENLEEKEELLREFLEERKELELELAHMQRWNKVLEDEQKSGYARRPEVLNEQQRRNRDMQRLVVLAGLSNEDPVWKTVLSYADEHEENESDVALKPGLSDGERQYNAGRAASARDFARALRDLRLEAGRKGARGS